MTTLIFDATSPASIDDAVDGAARLLRRGEVVAFPTETVYGLGADALDPEAIRRVFAAKGRPSDNPLIVHLAAAADMNRCAIPDERAALLADAFMPGPLTLVLRSLPVIPDIARAGLPTVALRVPAHPVAAALLARSGPLVAPSANISGRPSPTLARHVIDDLAGRIAAVIDGGACGVGIESTVVDLSGADVLLLRPGMITAAEIELLLGLPVITATGATGAPRAPGMKYRHYAPGTPVRLVIADTPPPVDPARRMVLTAPRHYGDFPGIDVRDLSAPTLYAAFRDADLLGLVEIVIYAAPGELDAGLLDRIRKAAAG
ncbi:MAG: translation factor [Chlorobi bacterium]|nr:translation factor [Chlorobiota bacterium]